MLIKILIRGKGDKMKKISSAHLITLAILSGIFFFNFSLTTCLGQQSAREILNKVQWLRGPAMGNLGEIAKVSIPSGYVFAGANDTLLLMEAMKNPTSGSELGFLSPETLRWYLVFEFSDIGYVKDDEKNSLDNDAMLKAIKDGTDKSNEERKKRGWPLFTVIGWEQPPRYNPITHNLEWAIRGESEGKPVINYNTRLLGRKGVMVITLVADPEDITAAMDQSKKLMDNFAYKEGNKYAEFTQGDKVAKYGLTALVVGGAAAVAAKAGIFKWLWKILVVVFLAVVGFIKKLFSGKTNRPT